MSSDPNQNPPPPEGEGENTGESARPSGRDWVAGRRKHNRLLLALLVFFVFLIYYVTIARQGGFDN